MAIKGCSAFLKAPALLEPRHEIVLYHHQDTRCGGGPYPSAEMQSMYSATPSDSIRLSIIWKSDLTDKMKRSFFQAAVASILLYGCTTWTLTKRLEKKLDGNYTRMPRAILNKSWRQHPTKHQLYVHLPPITKTIQVRRTRHAGHFWRSRDELIRDVL